MDINREALLEHVNKMIEIVDNQKSHFNSRRLHNKISYDLIVLQTMLESDEITVQTICYKIMKESALSCKNFKQIYTTEKKQKEILAHWKNIVEILRTCL